jgi:hypothetical protein
MGGAVQGESWPRQSEAIVCRQAVDPGGSLISRAG